MAADVITSRISGINNELVTSIMNLLFASDFLWITIPLIAAYFFIKDKKKLVLSLIIAGIIVLALKQFYAFDRPCVQENSKIQCPSDAAFPSGHAALSFSFVMEGLGHSSFYFFLIYALFISFLRIYSGVHYFDDVVAGALIGILSSLIAERFFRWLDIRSGKVNEEEEERGEISEERTEIKAMGFSIRKEEGRKIIHFFTGAGFLLLLLVLPIEGAKIVSFAALIFFLILISKFMRKRKTPFDFLISSFGTRDRFPAEGALWYMLGVVFIFLFFSKFESMFSALLFLSLGDALAGIIGSRGKIRLPWNRRKTLEGMLAFFLVSIPLSLLFPSFALEIVAAGALCAFAESMRHLPLDDNFHIPLLYFIVSAII